MKNYWCVDEEFGRKRCKNQCDFCKSDKTTTDIGKPQCSVCNLKRTPEGHDGCLGTLKGLMNACCGHGGKAEGAFVQFLDGSTIKGEDAEAIQEILKRNK